MKMELIAALIHTPKVLFLDEPTIGLDVVMQKSLREFIKEYNNRYNSTVILTSHYMGDVEALCKRVIVIDHGTILFDGLLADLAKKHAPYKIIKVIFKDFPNPKQLEGLGTVKQFEYPNLTLSVTIEKTNEVASNLLARFHIEDINIEDPEIEDVIREVFSNREKRNK
jgi:ABC-2 type transport system ATP-binding protein